MTIISYLILSVVLLFLMIGVQAMIGTAQYGLSALVGSRDSLDPPKPMLARAVRANHNMIEGMVMFAPLALLAIHTGVVTSQTALAGALFFFGRLAYVPFYWFGISWLRTLAWAVSVFGIVLLIINLLSLI